ncbi:hypothetical protein SDC9_56136 [bioreactor metagenome]|uniref:Uncharacterized protein n=1 Tax=bioreactor metagenome TaxID=1076179 RepID=A0A644X686_9ZZZZ
MDSCPRNAIIFRSCHLRRQLILPGDQNVFDALKTELRCEKAVTHHRRIQGGSSRNLSRAAGYGAFKPSMGSFEIEIKEARLASRASFVTS